MSKFPKIMGILNATPDSFSDGGQYLNINTAMKHAEFMINNGVDIIDIGGESTRPGSLGISIDKEISRVIPIIELIHKKYPDTVLSIDTQKFDVALQAIKSGATIINDISGLQNDSRLANLASETNSELVIMHKKGSTENMQENPHYEDIVEEVFEFLSSKIQLASSKGVKKIYADIGIGFGKTYEHNLTLLKNLGRFKALNISLLLGISRKAFIGKLFGIDNAADRDFHTALIHSLLLKHDIEIIRVHNVQVHNDLRVIYTALD